MVPVSFLYDDMCRNTTECSVFFVHDCTSKMILFARILRWILLERQLKTLLQKFFDKLYTISKDVFYEISDYEIHDSSRWSRATLYLPEEIKAVLKSNCQLWEIF